ncbi:MAG: hypothetical protein ACR2PR_11560, partial [Pseudohongiellaceae bacterium]
MNMATNGTTGGCVRQDLPPEQAKEPALSFPPHTQATATQATTTQLTTNNEGNPEYPTMKRLSSFSGTFIRTLTRTLTKTLTKLTLALPLLLAFAAPQVQAQSPFSPVPDLDLLRSSDVGNPTDNITSIGTPVFSVGGLVAGGTVTVTATWNDAPGGSA